MEDNGILGGLDFFLKNKNTEEGVTDQRDLENIESGEKEIKEETQGKETTKESEGMTLEEIEAEMRKSTSSDEDEDSSDEEEESSASKKKTTETEEEEESDSQSDDFWKDLSVLLKEKGIVEEDFDNPDKMVEVFGKEVEKGVNDWIDSLPDEVKDIVNAASEGLNGQSLKAFIESKDNQIQLEAVEDSDIEEDVELAKSILRANLRATTKYSNEKIEKHISRLEDLDELVDEAKEAKSALIEIEKEQRAEIKRQHDEAKEQEAERQKQLVQQVQKTVTETKEIVPGLKLSDKEQKELLKMITTPVELRGNQPVSAAMKLRETNPIDFEMKLNYFILKGFFEGKFEDVVEKAGTKKAVSKIESQIEASAKKLLAKTTSKVREEENPNGDGKSSKILAGWSNRKK